MSRVNIFWSHLLSVGEIFQPFSFAKIFSDISHDEAFHLFDLVSR